MVKVNVTPSVLKWARKRYNLSVKEVAKRIGKKPSVIKSWENGEENPTYVQLETIAYQIYKCPLGVFFFPEPPSELDKKSSFRTLPNHERKKLSYSVMKLIDKAESYQLSLKELYDNKNPFEPLITNELTFSKDFEIEKNVKEVRNYLGVSLKEQFNWKGERIALKEWRESLEKAGVFVFKDAFKDDKISGFCLYDDKFPLIYINNSMPKTRQIFTLFHEITHLLFGLNGIDKMKDDFLDILADEEKKIEIFCNQFAADFLVPNERFNRDIDGIKIDEKSISKLANKYSVSREVITRKLLDLGMISERFYREKRSKWIKEAKEKKKGNGGGGNYYYTKLAYLSNNYLETVFKKYHSREISPMDVSDYLNVKINNIASLEAYFN
ncbi:MAG: ImmA/IrrE family metallo-endopeptidase [Candidatus Woesearchaeota archaeon]